MSGQLPDPSSVRGARALAVVGIVLNGAWGLAVLILAVVLFGFNLLGIMWGTACLPKDAASLGLLCSRTVWPAIAIAGSGVLLTGIVQAVVYPMRWRQSILVVPAAITLVLTIASGVFAWVFAQAGVG